MFPLLLSKLNVRGDLRDNLIGAAALFVLVNLTLLPFLWGHRSLRDSVSVASLYASGSRSPAAVRQPTPREVDPGAPGWTAEPWFALEHDIVTREGVAPLWNPYSAFGAPLAANMQSQPYSPFAWIAISSKRPEAYNYFIASRVFAAGLFAFLFLRLFVGIFPALVGGAAFMYAGYFWEYLTMPEMSVEVCIPGLLYVGELLLRRQNLTRIALFGAFTALAVFGGMPESLVLALALAYAYCLARLLGDPALRARSPRSAGALILASALGFGISALQLLPFLEYIPLSQNSHSEALQGLYVDPFSRIEAALYFAPLAQGPPWNNIFSGFSGYTILRGSFGCTVAFFALVAAVNCIHDAMLRRWSAHPVVFFSFVAVFCLAKRFGNPGVQWIGSLPVLRLVNFPKYEEALLACAVSVLAAFGVAAVMERRVSAFQCAVAAALPLIILTAATGSRKAAFAALAAHRSYYTDALLCALLFLAAGLAVATLARLNRLRMASTGLLALILVVGEAHASYIVPMFYVIDGEPSQAADTLTGAPYLTFLANQKRDGSRFFGGDGILYPDWSAAFGVRDVRGLDALYDSHYLPFVSAFPAPGADPGQFLRFVGTGPTNFNLPTVQRFLALSSVRFIASALPIVQGGVPQSSSQLSSPIYRTVFRSDPVTISEFAHPLPRLSLYRHVVVARDDATALALLPAPQFDPTSEAIVESAAANGDLALLEKAPRQPASGGQLVVDQSRLVRATFETRTPALAVLNDTFYPGWRALLDGRPVPILRTNYLFRGVFVGPGRHVLTFEYAPRSFVIGRTVTFFSLLFAIVMFVVDRRRRRLPV